MMSVLEVSMRLYERRGGASPAENKYYTLVMFDISDRKKYLLLTKLLKRYSHRIQQSVYEAYLKTSDIKRLESEVEKLMRSERYYDPADKVRIYRMSGSCGVIIYGKSTDDDSDVRQNIFI